METEKGNTMNLKDIVRESVITRQTNKTNVVFEDSDLKNIINEQTRVKLTNKVVSNAKLVCENASSKYFSKVLKENFDIENYTNERLEEFGLVLENYNLVTQIRDIVGVLTESDNEKYSDYFKEILILEQELSEGIGGFLGNQAKKYIGNPLQRTGMRMQNWMGGKEIEKLNAQKSDLERQLASVQQQITTMTGKNTARGEKLNTIPTVGQSFKKDVGGVVRPVAGWASKQLGKLAQWGQDDQAGGPQAGGPQAGGPQAGDPQAGGPQAGGPPAVKPKYDPYRVAPRQESRSR